MDKQLKHTVTRGDVLFESINDLIFTAQFNRRMVMDHYLNSSDTGITVEESEEFGKMLVTMALEQHYVFNLIDAIRSGETAQIASLMAIRCPSMNELIDEPDGYGDCYDDEE